MKKVVRILLAILMVMCLALSITACKSNCDKGFHAWDEGTITVEATCVKDGVKVFKCTQCDHGEKTEVVLKTGHTPIDASVAPDCTHAGTQGATKCKDCGEVIVAGTSVEALGHNVTTWTPCQDDDAKHEGTCTRIGCNVKVTADHVANADGTACKDCGISLVEAPCEHPNKTATTQDATCLTAEVKHWTCPDCDWTYDETVGTPLGHDFENQPWTPSQIDGKHEQTCAREGCHEKNYADHTPVTVPGTPAKCGVAGQRDGSKCSVCDHVLSVGSTIPALEHDYTGAAWTPTADKSQHERTCTRDDCGHKDVAEHVWKKNNETSVAATCTEAGEDHFDCVCGEHKIVPTDALDHDMAVQWSTGDGKHWHKCKRDGCTHIEDEGTHVYNDNSLRCSVCNNPKEGTNFVLSYTDAQGKVVEKDFETLAAAIASITDNTPVTIEMGTINNSTVRESIGIVIPSGIDVTINLKDKTYVVASNPVGSSGTESCGFQILAGSTVKLMNGTISSKTGSGVKMLIQNYADLTLDNITLDGTNLDLDAKAPNYTLSNNCGKVDLVNYANVIAREQNGVAFDVWYNLLGNYPDGVKVSVDATCTIDGVIEYGSAKKDVADLAAKATLSLPAGDYTIRLSGNANCATAGITIGGVRFAHAWDEGEQTKAPSCKEAGETTHHCTIEGCNGSKTESITKLPHTEVAIPAQAPTCTEIGHTAGVKCSVCDEIIDAPKEIAAKGHNLANATYVGGHKHTGACTNCDFEGIVACTIVDDACIICKRELYVTEDGNVTIDTSKQGYADASEVTKIESGKVTVTFDKGSNSNSSKYYTSGTAIRVYGGNTFTVSVPEGSIISKITLTFGKSDGSNKIKVDGGKFENNSWSGSANSVTFTIDGTTGNRRLQTITVEFTAKNCNHFFGEWQTTIPETCTTDGEKTRVCLDCEITETDVIKAHHTFGDLVPEDNGSCLGDGTNGHVAHYQCSVCHKYFDTDKTTEIDGIVKQWEHSFEVVDEVPATAEHSGKQSYNHCTVCNRDYELDGTTLITDIDSWGIIPFNCEHTTYVWKLINDQHMYVCDACGDAQADKTHTPTAGTWSGTDVHSLSCGGDGCTLTISTHDADYAESFTVAGTDHVQKCQGTDCTIVNEATKHAANLGTPVATTDKSKHYQACAEAGCNYQTDPVDHSATEFNYVGNGKHEGDCACGEKVTANCTPTGADNACSACGRIVGEIISSELTETVVFKDKGFSNASSVKGLTQGEVSFEFDVGNNSNNNDPKYYSTGTGVRTYIGNTIKISVKSGVITSVKFVFSGSNNFNNYESGAVAWTGEQDTLTIEHTTSSASRIQQIIVGYKSSLSCHHDGENTLVRHDKVDATCTEVGYTSDYWQCKDCNLCFETEACTKLAETEPATGHSYGELISKRAATCENEEYFIDHYYCAKCQTYFDENKNEVKASDVVGTTVDHDWGAWTHDEELNADGQHTHSRTCAYNTSHVETATCELTWEYNETQHWQSCKTCTYSTTPVDHVDVNGDGICDNESCGYDLLAKSVTVTVDGGSESVVEVSITKARIGEEITFTVTVDDNYRLVSVIDFGTTTEIERGADGSYTYTFVEDSVDADTQAIELYIEVVKQVTVKLSAVENGTMTVTYGSDDNVTTVTDGMKVDVDTTLTITVTPNDGYEVKAVSAGGTAITPSDGKYTVSIDTTMTTITISAEVGEIRAEAEIITALDFKNKKSAPSDGKQYTTYSNQWKAKNANESYEWSIVNFNSLSAEPTAIRAGAKSTSSGEASISVDIANSVSKIVINFAKLNTNGTLNSITVNITNANGDVSSVSGTVPNAAGKTEIPIDNAQKDCTYEIVFAYSNTSTKNGTFDIDLIEYWG